MVIGARTCVPLAGGLIVGICMSIVMFPPEDLQSTCYIDDQLSKQPIDSSEFWKVNLEKPPTVDPKKNSEPKVQRTRFAASELGIRERLMVGILAESALSVSLNASLSRHVTRVQVWADASRVDAEMSQLSNLSPYRMSGQHTHSHVLQGIQNMSLHENYDWFLLVKDSTYINPFELNRFINKVNWNEKVLIGSPDAHGRCRLDGGVLLTHSAMKALVQNRASCGSIIASSDQAAFEECLSQATNLTCTNEHEGFRFSVWHTPSGLAAHDAVSRWSTDREFNSSIAVTQLLSESDSKTLHDHFVRVEMALVDNEITNLSAEVEELFKDISDGPTWPAALPKYSKPQNRYQIPTWEFFTLKDIFRNEPNQNVRPLEGKDLDDVQEVLIAARSYVESSSEGELLEFVQMRNGYRLFDPVRGMDYIVDLVYKHRELSGNGVSSGQSVSKRVHLTRMIAATQLLHQVPYVKEDTDIVIVVPIKREDEVLPARRLLARHARLCTSPSEESRKTRIVMATSDEVDQRSVIYINNDLEELKKRCRRSALEAVQLGVKSGSSVFSGAALDEAVDHFGAQTIFLLLSPHADVQKEFFDRARINTIKKYQVFFPIPFVEYHPTISGMDIAENEVPTSHEEARDAALARLREATPPKRKRPLVVQKDHGRFDSLDFSVLAVYGSDYVQLRDRIEGNRMDLISSFLSQNDVHILRAVEPTLRLRYHSRVCDSELDESDYARCTASKRENVAAKDQLAKLLFHEE